MVCTDPEKEEVMKNRQFLVVAFLAIALAGLLVACEKSPTSPATPTRVDLTAAGIAFGANAITVTFVAEGDCWRNGSWVFASCEHNGSGTDQELDNQPAPPQPPPSPPPPITLNISPRRSQMWGTCTITVAPPRAWQQQQGGIIPPGCQASVTVADVPPPPHG